ncbi:MAG: helix-turn-helix domain-containing protein [Actinomycetota bacterium]|nr:helix-turn-helix domain-containing protein [Actinomycetota bacterium]
MRRKSFADMNCSVAQALEVVGDPWTLLIVRDALFGVRRFDTFQERLGIPRNTLANRLDLLVRHGVLERRQYQDRPARHEYVPTAKGRDLQPVLLMLVRWGDRWGCLDEAPLRFVDRTTGEPVEPELVDNVSGRPLSELTIRPVVRASEPDAPDGPAATGEPEDHPAPTPDHVG